MKAKAKDKRFRGRRPFTLQVKGKVVLDSGTKHSFRCITDDIGFHGLCLRIHQSSYFRPGQRVNLKIRLYRGDFFLRATGKVCWVRNSIKTASHMNIGIRFTRIRRYNAWCDRINQEFCRDMFKDTEGREICLEDQQDS